MTTVVGCPMHVIKSQMQNSKKSTHKNILHCIKYIQQNEGKLGFFRGFKVNLLKDVIFGSTYLGTYGTLQSNLPKSHYSNFLAGGLSSIVTWSLFFPLDTLRNSHPN